MALGVGAHGFVPTEGHVGFRYGNDRRSEVCLKRLEQHELAQEFCETISAAQHLDERLLTELRLTRGLDLAALERDLGATAMNRVMTQAKEGVARGDFWLGAQHLGVSPHSVRRLDSLIAELA